jgi:predicted lipid-binding transport protein (Tim44 family)
MSRSFRSAIAVAAAILIATAPTMTFAAAGSKSGGGMSAGSRGSQTYTAPPSSGTQRAQPIERSATQPTATNPARGATAAGAPAAAGVGGWAQRNPMLAGIAGGFIGAGIGSLLFGGAGGLGGGGFAGMLGMMLQLALIGGLAYLAFRMIKRRMGGSIPATLTTPEGATFRGSGGQPDDRYGYQAPGQTPGQAPGAPTTGGLFAGGFGGGAPALTPIAVADSDLDVFSGILLEVQAAWTAGDVAKLRALATPEMVSYFSEALSDNATHGFANHVENITLLKGDVNESWTEEGRDYVTATLTWSASDYNVKLDQPSVVVKGDKTRTVETTEVWTFMRGQGGRWLLSAIQQVG